ncbi:recombinase family protein [Actinomycetes bacterium KLBMP 9759]
MTPRRAAIYARISKDREGAGLGVERQQEDCVALAERLSVRVAAVHVDNDLSAYSGKPRPGYRALLEQVRSGEIDVVLAWHTDRLHRSPVELEEWIAACEPRGVAVHTVKAGLVDLSTPSGRAIARTLGAWARYDVEDKIEKQLRQKQQAAAAGKWRGGRRPFGYESDGTTVRPDEAAVVVEAAERVLVGESLHSVARDLNERAIVTSTGRGWKPTELRKVLMRARNAGLIEHAGREVGPATWPAILEPALWRTLRRLLTAQDRRPPRSQDLRWLGSGLFLCGVCGDGTTMLSASARSRAGGGRTIPSYRCRAGTHLTRVAAPLDDFVSALVIERLSQPDARLMLAAEDRRVDVEALHVRRTDAEARMTELAGLFADGTVTGPQLAEATRKLRAEIADVEASIAASTAHSPLFGFADSDDVRAAWAAATVSRRKAVVAALMTVTLVKAARGRPAGWVAGQSYFDPSAVKISWEGSLGRMA